MPLQGSTHPPSMGQDPMATLRRSRPWAQTPLGEVTTWPAALKTTLGIVLSAEIPMMGVWGEDRRVFYNPACVSLLPGERLQGEPWASLGGVVGAGDALATAIEGVFATGRSQFSATAAAGYHPWACSPIWDDLGQVGGVLVTGHWASDVSGSGISGNGALSESEERFRHLADNISQLVWMADATGAVLWCNQRWFDFAGPCLTQRHPCDWTPLHHPDHQARVLETYRRCMATGEVWEDTFPLRGQDGQYRWFLARAIPVRDGQGNVLWWVGTHTDITELRQTEKSLKQVSERLNIALKSAPITLFNQDCELRYTWVYNPTHNYLAEEMLGQRDEDLVSAESAARLTPLKRQVLDSGVGLRAEVQVEQAFYDLTIDPIRDRQGRITGVTCAAVDISDRARLEAEHQRAAQTLRKGEEQLRMAQQAAGAGLWDWDMVTGEVTWSEEYYHLYGLDREVTPSYENWLATIVPIDRARVEQKICEAIEQGKNLKVNFRIEHPEEGQRWLMVRGQTFYDSAQHPIRMTGIAINITEQKRFEQALIASEAIARTQTEELAALMETTPAAIWIAHDADCRHMTANRMAHELMGTQPEGSSLATPTGKDRALPFKQCKQGQEIEPQNLPMEKAIRTGQEVTDEIEFVYPDGRVRTIYGKAVPLYNAEGQVRGAIAGFAEITALKQSEREREDLLQRERVAREEAEQANRLKDQFLAVLSHELRSPLNPILGWAKLLQTRTFDAAKTTRALATIERNAQLQAQLVDDLLDLAKILRGKLHLNPMPVRLTGVIESALETVKAAAATKSIALRLDLDSTVQVAGDAARLQQIVGNLLSNAIKFTPEQGQVTVTLRSLDDQAEVSVSDTGIGISADFLPYLFESFRQEDISITRKHGGLGLGLAIVRQLVEVHGGTISARSPGEGQGATFSVLLPQLPGEALDDPAAALPRPALNLSGIRVFSIDDSADTREFLTTLLGQYGADVVTAGSANEALDSLKTLQPDVLISDIGMPEMDGYSLIRQIRSLPPDQGGAIPAIALTAYARDEDQQRSLASGYQRHLTKPLDLEKLVQAVVELTQPHLP